MTAASLPPRTSRLPTATSPCTQTDGRVHRVASARSSTVVAQDASPPVGQGPRSPSATRPRRRGGRPAEEAVRAGERAIRRVRRSQGAEERGQVDRERVQVVDAADGRRLPREPAVHRPRPREADCGSTLDDRCRDRQRQLRGEPGQAALLLLDGGDVALRAREPDRQLVAEPERAVVPAAGQHLTDQEVRPVREALGDQPGREVLVDAFTDQGILTALARVGIP